MDRNEPIMTEKSIITVLKRVASASVGGKLDPSVRDQLVEIIPMVQLLTDDFNAVSANARLIAAAPELKDLLAAAIARIELANQEGNPILSAWLPDAKAAIAKVEGAY